jgi:hypothetical protein
VLQVIGWVVLGLVAIGLLAWWLKNRQKNITVVNIVEEIEKDKLIIPPQQGKSNTPKDLKK